MAAPYNDNIKEKILSSTKEILERKSFNEITLASIAKATGVSKGTIYYYYKNKDMILADVADSYFESMYKELKSWAYNKEKDTSLPRVLNFVVSRGVEDEKKSLRFHLLAEAISGNEYVRSRLIERYESFREIIGDVLAQRLDKNSDYYYGWLLLTIIDGLMVQNLLDNANLDRERFLTEVSQRLFSVK